MFLSGVLSDGAVELQLRTMHRFLVLKYQMPINVLFEYSKVTCVIGTPRNSRPFAKTS